jgi:hypothetical protein
VKEDTISARMVIDGKQRDIAGCRKLKPVTLATQEAE